MWRVRTNITRILLGVHFAEAVRHPRHQLSLVNGTLILFYVYGGVKVVNRPKGSALSNASGMEHFDQRETRVVSNMLCETLA